MLKFRVILSNLYFLTHVSHIGLSRHKVMVCASKIKSYSESYETYYGFLFSGLTLSVNTLTAGLSKTQGCSEWPETYFFMMSYIPKWPILATVYKQATKRLISHMLHQQDKSLHSPEMVQLNRN